MQKAQKDPFSSNMHSLQQALREQTTAYFPWTDNKCSNAMQKLTTTGINDQEKAQKIYTILTAPSCQSLFRTRPWIIWLQQFFSSSDSWSTSKQLAIQLQTNCYLPFKKEIQERLAII